MLLLVSLVTANSLLVSTYRLYVRILSDSHLKTGLYQCCFILQIHARISWQHLLQNCVAWRRIYKAEMTRVTNKLQHFYRHSLSSILATCLGHHSLLYFIILTIICDLLKLQSFSLTSIQHVLITSWTLKQSQTDQWWTIPYFPAHKMHREFFVRNFRKK